MLKKSTTELSQEEDIPIVCKLTPNKYEFLSKIVTPQKEKLEIDYEVDRQEELITYRIDQTQNFQLVQKQPHKPRIMNRSHHRNSMSDFLQRIITARFIKKLRTLSGNVSINTVKLQYLQLLNDPTFDKSSHQFEHNVIAQVVSQLQEKQHRKSNILIYIQSSIISQFAMVYGYYLRLPVLLPTSKICVLIDVLCLIFTLHLLLVSPIKMAYFDDTQDMLAFDFTLHKGTLFFEIIFQFSLGYYQEGQIIMDRQKISKNYFFGGFLYDFLTLIVIFIFDGIYNWLQMVFLLRIYKLDSYFLKLIFVFRIKDSLIDILNLIRLSYIIIFSSNLIGCLWYVVVRAGQTTWMISYEDLQYFGDRYIQSLYWAVTTMLTVGYGDIKARSNSEYLFSMMTMLFGCCMYAYIMNSIGAIVDQLNAEKKLKMKQTFILESYLSNKPVDIQLKQRLRTSYQNHFSAQYQIQIYGQEFLKHIPQLLSIEYKNQIERKLFLKNPVFAQFNEKLINNILNELEQITLLPHENLPKNDSLYIVESGEIVWQYLNFNLDTCRENRFIQVEEFFTGESLVGKLVSTQISNIHIFKRDRMLRLIEQTYDSSLEKFHHIKDSIMLYKNYKVIDYNCPLCHQSSHTVFGCTHIHLNINKYNYLKREQRACYQQRNYIQRYKQSKQDHTFLKLQETQALVLLYIETNLTMTISASMDDSEQDLEKKTSISKESPQKTPIERHDYTSITNLKQISERNSGLERYSGVDVNTPGLKRSPGQQGNSTSIINHQQDLNIYLFKSIQQINSEKDINMIDFERFKNWDNYFPHNNIDQILKDKKLDRRTLRNQRFISSPMPGNELDLKRQAIASRKMQLDTIQL